MRYSSSLKTSRPRRGMVLLVVMAMLSLFSAVALSFVFYADAEAVASNNALKSISKDQADVDPEVLAAHFLSQLIYPTENIYSALRGHELARSIYGYNPATLNYTPYNGIGRSALSYPVTFNSGGTTVDNFNLINYTKYEQANSGVVAANDPFIGLQRNPEWFGKTGDGASFRYVGGANPPWTAYDTNSLFLAQVTADGKVLMPSFARPWNGTGAGAASKYMTLRPHTSWHNQFVTPDSEFDAATGITYDVRNLDFGPGAAKSSGGFFNNDSFWIDAGFPIMTAPNGKRYKALVAPLIMDLSNRLHLYAHGNQLGGSGNIPYGSVSNQGWSASEVNLCRLPNLNAAELAALFTRKYGGANAAGAPAGFRPSNTYTFAGAIDANGLDTGSGLSTGPLVTGFATTGSVASGNSMSAPLTGTSPRGFPWAIQPGMTLGIDVGTNYESVQVASVNAGASTFTTTWAFTKVHTGAVPVAFSTLFPFPTYPSTGWNNANAVELTNNPLGYNLFSAISPNTAPLPMSQMEALLRFGGTNAPALTSGVFGKMPLTFGTAAGQRARNMVTLANWHFDRICASPYISFDPTKPGHYQYKPTLATYPKSNGVTPPNPANPAPPALVPENPSEYIANDWRSILGAVLRVNLNRALPDYPAPAVNGIITDTATFAAAQTARQQFARDIYNALIRVTGAQDPYPPTPAANVVVGSDDYNAARWLAQLAVNIVDFIDSDDIATPFPWYGSEILFGTEPSRLVLNEVYGQNDNDVNDPAITAMMQSSGTILNLWVELHNPLMTVDNTKNLFPNDSGNAMMVGGSAPQYDIIVCPSSAPLSAAMRLPDNNLGDPEFNNGGTKRAIGFFNDWPGSNAGKGKAKGKGKGKGKGAPLTIIQPANGAAVDGTRTNVGFFVVGPDAEFLPGRDPNLPTSYDAPEFVIDTPVTPITNITVVLRRLAAPHLPPQTDPTQPFYNPYITVDYLENIDISANDGRLYDAAGARTPNAWGTFRSWGRKQPYAANWSQCAAQTGTLAGTNPQTTFYAVNNPADMPFSWLVHLDRPLVNQLELRQVSGFKLHELTQQFMTAAGAFQHRAPWGGQPGQDSLLYRALDVLGTPNAMLGTIRGGRLPGNINLNTITEAEILLALADPQDWQPNPLFKSADVQVIYNKLITSRNLLPGQALPVGYNAAPPLTPTSEGTPFQPFSAGDIKKTLLRPDPTVGTGLLFGVGATGEHPYRRAALMNKIFNNVSTTSNVFAIWWTVGFFEVVDESVKPAKLGPEIGRSENRHIRHRFFAIVDRSALELFRLKNANATSAGANVTMNVGATSGTLSNGQAWTLSVGMMLEMQSPLGVPMEVVTVTAVNATSFTADFTQAYPAGAFAVLRGNPGPKANFNAVGVPPAPPYNPRQDTGVVLHLSVIQ